MATIIGILFGEEQILFSSEIINEELSPDCEMFPIELMPNNYYPTIDFFKDKPDYFVPRIIGKPCKGYNFDRKLRIRNNCCAN